MHIAFCVDAQMEAALHVVASSLLRHLKPGLVPHFHVVLAHTSPGAEGSLRRTLDRAGRQYELTFSTVLDATMFLGFRPLHGNMTPYYRLLLPQIVTGVERLLYLDSDMLVMGDVSPLFDLDMEGKALGFVVDGKLAWALERDFFLSLGLRPDDPGFNTGTMLINLPEWYRQNCRERIFSFCQRHRDQLMTADQTALLALFSRDCVHLDTTYNAREPNSDTRVLHYIGLPKPWDKGARWLLPHARLWWEEFDKTAYDGRNPGSWRRVPKLLGGYKRLLVTKAGH